MKKGDEQTLASGIPKTNLEIDHLDDHNARQPAVAAQRSKGKGKRLFIVSVIVCALFVAIALGMRFGKTSPHDEAGQAPTMEQEIKSALSSGEIGESHTYDIGDDETIVIKYVPSGEFQMGSPQSEVKRHNHENQVLVTLTSHYWIGETEVTQGQWQVVMGNHSNHFKGPEWKQLPVENVSWEDANAFMAKLNETHPPGEGWKWALPTEAQWERACRGGTTTATAFGDSLSSRLANFVGDHPYGEASRGPYLVRTAPVKSYQPNEYGLYDMHGNVWEWCEDIYQKYLPGGIDPLVDDPSIGRFRVRRGGSLFNEGSLCRSASRGRRALDYRFMNTGFRIAAVPQNRM